MLNVKFCEINAKTLHPFADMPLTKDMDDGVYVNKGRFVHLLAVVKVVVNGFSEE